MRKKEEPTMEKEWKQEKTEKRRIQDSLAARTNPPLSHRLDQRCEEIEAVVAML